MLEVLVALALIALVMGISLPLVGGYLAETRLEAAAQDAVDAVRFAQASAARTQTYYRAVFNQSQDSRGVLYLDLLAMPQLAVNPCDKNPYTLSYPDDSRTAGVTIYSSRFEYGDGEVTNFVEFDPQGTARRSTSLELLEEGEVVLALGERQRRLEIRPNGTVSVQ